MKNPDDKILGTHYPEEFWPVEGEDVTINNFSLHWPNTPLIHELGEHAQWCWCEPEVLEYDEETDTATYQHRRPN